MVTDSKTIFSIVICLVVAVLATGCSSSDYADTINLDAGDAIATNKAVQTVDPWAHHAFKKRHPTNGKRIVKAYDKYQEVTAKTPKALAKK